MNHFQYSCDVGSFKHLLVDLSILFKLQEQFTVTMKVGGDYLMILSRLEEKRPSPQK